MRSRLAFVFLALPLCAYAYACSSDDAANPGPEDDAGTEPDTGGGGEDSGGQKDSGQDANKPADGGDGGGDSGDGSAGDAGSCTINPLADVPDGGAAVIGAAALSQVPVGTFPDGPQFVDFPAGGSLVFSEAYGRRIVRLSPDGGGAVTPIRTTTGDIPIGNAVLGNFLLTTQSPPDSPAPGNPAILRTAFDGGAGPTLAVGAAGSPNDLVVSNKGIVYFTDPPYQGAHAGGAYRLDPATGTVTAITLPADSDTPDGIAVSPEGDALYISVSGFVTPTDRKILRFPLDATGVVGTGTVLAGFTPKSHPTGIAVDVGGNLWIAENALAGAESGQVEVVSPTGKKWGEITIANSKPTGVAFGGADNKTVYITGERGAGDTGFVYLFASRCAGVR